MKDLVIVGSGGFAREVKWLIDVCNEADKRWNVIGWISSEKIGSIVAGLPVLGSDEWIITYTKPIDVVIGIGNGILRGKIVDRYRGNSNISFPNIIAPNALIGPSVKMGCGCIITSCCVLTVDITIGNFLISNLSTTIGHDTIIGDYVTLYPGAHISGSVTLGKCASIGTGAVVLQGLTIGANTFIGAGAAVIKDIPEECVAVGVPAKVKEVK